MAATDMVNNTTGCTRRAMQAHTTWLSTYTTLTLEVYPDPNSHGVQHPSIHPWLVYSSYVYTFVL